MARTKAQRSASAKKGVATRKRNAAKKSASGGSRALPAAPSTRVTGLAKAAASTAENAAKSVVKRVEAARGGGSGKRKGGRRKKR